MTSKSQFNFIIASSREWNKPFYEELVNSSYGIWHWVNSPLELKSLLEIIKPRYIFFYHWNWIVPKNVWMENECVCFHMTDLPYGRGGSPLQNLILAGHKQSKLTALKMDDDIDAGPIYTKRILSLEGTAKEIYIRAGRLSTDIVQWMISNYPEPLPQEGEIVKFKRRTPNESKLPTNGSLLNIFDFIRMLDADGYPFAFVEHGNYKIYFRNAQLDNDSLSAIVEIKMKSNIE